MKIPKMILFDYGQTLIAEQRFDGIKGTEAVLKHATRNKYNLTAEQIQERANELNKEFGRYDPEKKHLLQIEIPNTMFTPYLYDSLGIEIALSNAEIDTVFWDAAAPGVPTEGIENFLEYLKNKGIRTGVISNIAYAQSVVAGRINRMLPGNSFEFIITSSNYIFRKPSKRIFDLALEKSGLNPDETWYIGDQYECDIKGALNAGIFPVWYIGAIDLPYKDDKNILTVKTWDKLMEIMSVS
ncbi:MAG: HAD-IA family hydrolase [Lachnospiraceae bacterium]|nr:HAD-IA family hydrolase [Lachnospiraceae bacterium]